METMLTPFATGKATALGTAHGSVHQSCRSIPTIASVDVVVVGGTVAGVAAAEAAAGHGARVFLVAPRPYLGEDLCATLRLEPKAGRSPATPLEKRLFQAGISTPAVVKATLVDVLLEAGVRFTFASYATDILHDANGDPCGVAITNRAGRQAIVAKVIVDATDQAWVCRMAGCTSAPWSGGTLPFHRITLHADGRTPGEGTAQSESGSVAPTRRAHALDVDMPDLSFASFAAAEQVARDETYTDDLLRASESLFTVPPYPIACRSSGESQAKDTAARVEHFRPSETSRLYVLSGSADITRAEATALLSPGAMTAMGAEIGRAAATEAAALPGPNGVHIPGRKAAGTPQGDVREPVSGERPDRTDLPRIPCEASGVPVLADVDVVVVGGGTAGAPAAIAAARRGARTLVLEYQEGLGGVGTLGLIGKPYHGRKTGFAAEVPFPDNVEQKMEWYRAEIRQAGGTVVFGVLGTGAFIEGNAVKGVVVCSPEGRGVVLAKVVIDATGNADVAISAGAHYQFGGEEDGDIALQGAGLPPRDPGVSYHNTDYLLVDESDMTDVWRTLASVHRASRAGFDVGPLLQTRERRRVVGDFVMRYVDQIAERTYPDSIVFSGSDYDSHGYPSSVFFALLPHDAASRKANHPAPGGTCFTPYRCLLPQGLGGIVVTGLGISMDRDATAMVRMQLDMANQGYAAGTAAAMAARTGVQPRYIPVRELQKHLIDVGCLPASVLTHGDSFPMTTRDVERAVRDYGAATNPGSAGPALAVLLTHQAEATPLIREALGRAGGQAEHQYAKLLAVLGDRAVVPMLVAALEEVPGWDPKIYQGAMAEYAHLPTPVDSIIVALGYSGDRAATSAIVRMLDSLNAEITLSHHRAVALALERLRDPAAAEPLARLLRKPGMRGHALTALPTGAGKVEERTASLREITLARALYHCGDHQALGQDILECYQNDLRGLFVRHAQAVLGKKQTMRDKV